MYKVTVQGKTVVWNRHANQLRIRSVTLPMPNTSDNSNSDSTSSPDPQNSQHESPTPTLRRSSRIRKPRIPWSPSN